MRGFHSPGAARDDGLRRLSKMTWRATQLSAIAAVGLATLFARSAVAHTTSATKPVAQPSPHATPGPSPARAKRRARHHLAAAPATTATPGNTPAPAPDPAAAPSPTHTLAPPPTTPAPAPGWRLVELERELRTVRMPAGVVLDLGATAKALAADRAAARVAAAVGCGVLVNLGGDIAIAGHAPQGGWRVRVSDEMPADQPGRPTARRARPQVISISSGAVATSCTASRGWRRGDEHLHHIIVPGTGRPADGCWRTATVAAATCVGANTASTAAIIRGEQAVPWLERNGLPARLVRGDGRVVTTCGWPDGEMEGNR
jgi:hypothetical protein